MKHFKQWLIGSAQTDRGNKMSNIEALKKTSDYSRFTFMKGQRPVNINTTECRVLVDSMCEYGFLPAYPLMVRPNGAAGKFVIVDGQHRFTVAKELGLEVYYVVDQTSIDVTKINKTQRQWKTIDYAHRWASEGLEAYRELIDFHIAYDVPITTAASVLRGTIAFVNIKNDFYEGRFFISNRDKAIEFFSIFKSIYDLNKRAKNNNFITALWSCFFVEYFEPERLVSTIRKYPQKLTNCGTRENFLALIEEIYNHGRKCRAPLKFDAEEAMRARNPRFAGVWKK